MRTSKLCRGDFFRVIYGYKSSPNEVISFFLMRRLSSTGMIKKSGSGDLLLPFVNFMVMLHLNIRVDTMTICFSG